MGIETMYSVNVSQVATVSFEGVISDIGSKDPLSFATVQLLHGDEVHSVLSKDNGVFSFPSVHPGDYILRITYVGYDRYTETGYEADRKNGPFGKFVERNCRDGAGVAGAGKLVEDKSRNDDPFAAYQF